MERFFDIKKSDGIVVKKVDKIMLGTKQTQVEYFIRLKFEIIEIRNCIRYIVLETLKKLAKLLKRAGKRQWIGWYFIDRENRSEDAFVRPIKTFSTTPKFCVFYVFPATFCFTTISFIPRPRFLEGNWNQKGEGSIWNIKF